MLNRISTAAGGLLALLLCLSVLGDDSLRPAPVNPPLPAHGETVMAQCGEKFTRGLANALTGLGEIPRQIIISDRRDGLGSAMSAGFFGGVFMAVARTGFGVVEAATFLMPLDGTYDSLLKPDYVWGPLPQPDSAARN